MKFILLTLLTIVSAKNLLFTSISHEVPEEELIYIDGFIPKWVEGTLYRNGFGKFEGNGFKFNHLFDCLSLLVKFNIQNSEIYYQAKLQRSHYYNEAMRKKPTYRTLGGLTPDFTDMQKIATLAHPNHDNYNANIVRMGTHLTAISDTLGSVMINSKTLDYIAKYPFNDSPLSLISCAHPNTINFYPELQYNYLVEFFPIPKYIFYVVDTSKEEPYQREYLLSIQTDKISYVHSFGMSIDYIIFVTYPFYWNVEKIAESTTILPTMKWNPEDKTIIYIIHKKEKRVVWKIETEVFFSFHHVNAWEDKSNIYFDMIVYNNSNCIQNFYLKNISNMTGFIGGNLRKFHINLNTGILSWEEFNEFKLEMPQINTGFKGVKYNFIYSMGNMEYDDKISLVKMNRNDGSTLLWNEPGHFPSEPIFIANPDGKKEDDGILLSIVLNEYIGLSYLLILDANTMDTMGKAYLNMSLPLSCHGFFDE